MAKGFWQTRWRGSRARQSIDSVVHLRRSLVGWMSARIDSWIWAQASYHNTQGIVNSRVDEVCVGTMGTPEPDRYAVHKSKGGREQSRYQLWYTTLSLPKASSERCVIAASYKLSPSVGKM